MRRKKYMGVCRRWWQATALRMRPRRAAREMLQGQEVTTPLRDTVRAARSQHLWVMLGREVLTPHCDAGPGHRHCCAAVLTAALAAAAAVVVEAWCECGEPRPVPASSSSSWWPCVPGVPRLRHGNHREQVGGQGRGQHQSLGGMVLRGTHIDGGAGAGLAAGPGGHRGQGAGRRQKPRRVARWGRGC